MKKKFNDNFYIFGIVKIGSNVRAVFTFDIFEDDEVNEIEEHSTTAHHPHHHHSPHHHHHHVPSSYTEWFDYHDIPPYFKRSIKLMNGNNSNKIDTDNENSNSNGNNNQIEINKENFVEHLKKSERFTREVHKIKNSDIKRRSPQQNNSESLINDNDERMTQEIENEMMIPTSSSSSSTASTTTETISDMTTKNTHPKPPETPHVTFTPPPPPTFPPYIPPIPTYPPPLSSSSMSTSTPWQICYPPHCPQQQIITMIPEVESHHNFPSHHHYFNPSIIDHNSEIYYPTNHNLFEDFLRDILHINNYHLTISIHSSSPSSNKFHDDNNFHHYFYHHREPKPYRFKPSFPDYFRNFWEKSRINYQKSQNISLLPTKLKLLSSASIVDLLKNKK